MERESVHTMFILNKEEREEDPMLHVKVLIAYDHIKKHERIKNSSASKTKNRIQFDKLLR